MKTLTTMILLVGAAMVSQGQSISPQVVASAGTHFSNGSAQLSWTIGEPMTATFDNGTNILTQGFHQPLLTVTGITEPNTLSGVMVYPNPASYLLNVQVNNASEAYRASLYDLNGKVVLDETLPAGSTLYQLDLSGYAAGQYLLRMTQGTERSATFNIQKIQP